MFVPLVFVLSVAVASITSWRQVAAPFVALSANIGSDAVGMLLVIRETRPNLATKAWGTWLVTILGDLTSVLAVASAHDERLLPVDPLVSNGRMLAAIAYTDLWMLRPGSRLMQPAVRHTL